MLPLSRKSFSLFINNRFYLSDFILWFCRDQSGHLLIGCEGHVCQNVLLNLSPGLKRDIVGITMSVVIILSYVLILAPAREHIEHFALE